MSEHIETVEIQRMAHGGDGVGYLEDGRIVFVPMTLPGDVARVEVTELKSSFARAKLLELESPSEDRVEPECPYFDDCGGCQFWHTSHQTEFELKSRAAHETLERISHLDMPEPELNRAPRDNRYRTRVTFHREKGDDGPWKVGFYGRGSDELVAIEDCLITEDLLNDVRRALEPALRDIGDADIVLETAGNQEAVVTIRPDENIHKAPPSLKEFTRTIDGNQRVRGVRLVTRSEHRVWGDTTVDANQVLAHPPVEGARVSSMGFRQIYPEVNRMVVDAVADVVESSGASSVLELFSGHGNIAFGLPESVGRLVGLESNPDSVESARGLAKVGQRPTFQFEVADLSDGFVEDFTHAPQQFDAVILDPPREGALPVARELAEYDHFDAIVYVSCDPACLARDLEAFDEGGWSVETLHMFDMFPRTGHIEVLAVLQRQG